MPRLVFLAAHARGGSSWALKVLDAHPRVCGVHEPLYRLSRDPEARDAFRRIKAATGSQDDAERVLAFVLRGHVETQKPPFFDKTFLPAPAWLRGGVWGAARAVPALAPLFAAVSTGRLDGRHRVVVKNRPCPSMARVLGALDASAILLLRHPCAVVHSWMTGIRLGAMPPVEAADVWQAYSPTLRAAGLTEARVSALSQAGLIALHWLADVAEFQRLEASEVPTIWMVYGELLRDPVGEWRRVFDWMQLPFDPAVARFLDRSSRGGFDLRRLLGARYSYFSVARHNPSSVEGWREEMPADAASEVLDLVGPHFPLRRFWAAA